MRTLVLLRGAPASGKSTWIKNQGLEEYSLSPDTVRTMYSSPKMQVDGSYQISQEMDTEVWTTVFSILESRMQRGEFTIIDATNSKTRDMSRYKQLASAYRYRMFVVDFTDVPLETCLEQNRKRAETNPLKFVPESAIKNIYARFATQQVPSGIKVLKRDNIDEIWETPFDLSSYKKVVHIGDIHGCYDTLMKYFEDHPMEDDVEYIFTGDYLDRGPKNAEVFKFLSEIKDKPNVCLLAGNHEKWIDCFGNNVPAKSKEFEYVTKPQLILGNCSDKEARAIYRKIKQCSFYKYHDKIVLACHGGVPSIGKHLTFIPTEDFIHGVGEYADYKDVADNWYGNTPENYYLIHGHRNIGDNEIDINDRVYNLEGSVEFGGELRVVELDADGFHTIVIPCIDEIRENKVAAESVINSETTVHDVIESMTNNKFINVKSQPNHPTIVSYNFSREAFFDKNWNSQTVLARGLFLDTEMETVVARSYEKFFNIGERMDTNIISLQHRFTFPVTAYVKENGFLAMISYDVRNDDLLIASKSSTFGYYVGYIKNALDHSDIDQDALKAYVKENNRTLVFECIDPLHDPHIIKHTKTHLILLDAIDNTIKYEKISYEDLVNVAKTIKSEVKELAYVFHTYEEFRKFYYEISMNEDWQYHNKYIEGFVFEDANGFMVKYKTQYYNYWKMLRGVSETVLKRGYYTKTGSLQTAESQYFLQFLKNCYNNDYDKISKTYPYPTDIISLRTKFYDSMI